jgi:hypothetical protein
MRAALAMYDGLSRRVHPWRAVTPQLRTTPWPTSRAVSAGLRAILVRTRPADGSRHVADLAELTNLVSG